MPFWSRLVCCFFCVQSGSAQYFFWTLCQLQYGGECRSLCHDGEVNLGLPYCSTPDDDVANFPGTCCVALPCWYLGGICRRSCIPLYETKYDLPTTCPDFRSSCCMSSHDLPTTTPSSGIVTTAATSASTTAYEGSLTTLPEWIGNCGQPQITDTSYSLTSPGPCVFPWVVSIRTTYSQHYCSGVLVSDQTVLTVAGCVEGVDSSQLVVTLGAYDVTVKEGTEVDVNVTSITRHPLHRNNRRGNDLALLKFGDVLTNSCVSRVCLPGINTSPANLGYGRCLRAGWGESQAKLTVRPVRVYETPACARLLSALRTNNTLPDDVICTLEDQTNQDGDCGVDGGSMLMCPDLNDRYFLFGSVTEFMCDNPTVSLYTDISYHSAWIKRHIRRIR